MTLSAPKTKRQCVSYAISSSYLCHHWLYVPTSKEYQDLRDFLVLNGCTKDIISDDHYLVTKEQKADWSSWLKA